jgi:hypothetical protein
MHCQWCSRDDVPTTKKGGLANHVDAGGKKCIAVGMAVAKDTRTPPKKIYPTFSRNRRR